MPAFSKKSLEKLNTCHPDLRRLFLEMVVRFDCTVLCGHRGEAEQDEANRTGRSQVKFPNSLHNSKLSMAVDVAPYPVDWTDRDRFHYFAGQVVATAHGMGINLRWGGDWDGDTKPRNNKFDDLPHFETTGE